MPTPKRKSEGAFEAVLPGRRLSGIGLAVEGATPVSSTVHHFHAVLETAFAPEPEIEKWSGAVRVLILGAAIVGPWASIFVMAKLALR